jgi:outer membrane protein assembly factor BamB
LLYNNLAYWCKNDTELICVNIDNGEEVYSISTRPWLYTDPLLKSGRIIFGTSGADGFLKNIDAESGEEIWSLPLKNGCASFSFHGDTVIAGDFEKKLYRIDFASGKILRELNVGGEVVGKVSVENGSAYTVVWGNEAEPIKLIKVRLY